MILRRFRRLLLGFLRFKIPLLLTLHLLPIQPPPQRDFKGLVRPTRMLQRQVSKRSATGKGAGFGGGDSSLQPMFEGQETELLNTVDEEKYTGEVVTIQRRWRGSIVRHKLKDFIANLREKEANRKLHIESRNISEIGIELSKNLDMFFLNTMPWIYVMTMAVLFISIDY